VIKFTALSLLSQQILETPLLMYNSGRPFVSRSSITRIEQSASCCQRHAVTAVFPSAFKDISVSIVIRLLTVSLVLSQRLATDNYVKCPCNNFIKRHFNQYFVNNNNNNNNNNNKLLAQSPVPVGSTVFDFHFAAFIFRLAYSSALCR